MSDIETVEPKLRRNLNQNFGTERVDFLDELRGRLADATDGYKAIGTELTPTQRTIFMGRACGMSDQDIAARLGILPQTVRNHASVARKHLGLREQKRSIALAGALTMRWMLEEQADGGGG